MRLLQSIGTKGKEVSSSALSVLVNPKDPHTVQLRQLGDEHSEQGNSVDHKMGPIVFGVKAGKDVQDNGCDGEELPRSRKLHTIVHLLPVCEKPGLALIRGLKRRPFDCVKQEVHAQIMDEIGEGPDHRYAGEGNAKQYDVQEANSKDVGEPDPSTVHHPGVGVHLAVCCAHIHDGNT